MESHELHLDRARATSFGSVAEQYDRYRPECPDELIDELTASRPTRVLDVGCGTGKVARTLARRGLTALGVEADERMADVARGHGIEVEVAPFETWDDAGRRFDLMTCGDAWHWIDPDAGIAKAARVLDPGARPNPNAPGRRAGVGCRPCGQDRASGRRAVASPGRTSRR
ncbi:class I SAM-dependent methyltransferase [Nonomuraea angiospora]|uniref:class I SAM-dependent methyltransferase n=1 Tax=Nonomuraea angiospora TaxID=46172 RepID=UPI0033D9D986